MEFYALLSDASRYARFLGYSHGLSDGTAGTFCLPDHEHSEGFVALSRRDSGQVVVGHLCLEPAGQGRLEVALAVSDAFQGQGIGRRLLRLAIDWAIVHSYEQIVASAFAHNSRLLRLLSSDRYPSRIDAADSGVVNVIVTLPISSRRHAAWPHRQRPALASVGSASRGSS